MGQTTIRQPTFISTFLPASSINGSVFLPKLPQKRIQEHQQRQFPSPPLFPPRRFVLARVASPIPSPDTPSTPSLPPQPAGAPDASTPVRRAPPRALPPRHWRVPYIGFYLDHLLRPRANLELARRYGPIYRTDFFGQPCLVVTTSQTVNAILRDNDTYLMRGAYPGSLDWFLGTNTLATDGPSQQRRKPYYTLQFTGRNLQSFWETVRDIFADTWREAQLKGGEKQWVKIGKLLEMATFEAIVCMTLGKDVLEGEHALDLVEMKRLFDEMAQAFFKPELPFGLGGCAKGKRAQKVLFGIIEEVERRKRREYKEVLERLSREEAEAGEEKVSGLVAELMGKGELDFFTLMLWLLYKKEDDPEDRRSFQLTILAVWFGGTETGAAVMTSAVQELLCQEGALEMLRKEQDELQGKRGDLTYAQLGKMKVMDAFFNEMMRLRSPGAYVFRRTRIPVTLHGHSVPANSLILCDLPSAMRDEHLFPHPERFDITRYLDTEIEPGEMAMRKQMSMLGFGGGPHRCTGAMLAKMEFKTAMSLLIRDYDFKLKPNVSRKFVAFPMLHPGSNVPLRLRSRLQKV